MKKVVSMILMLAVCMSMAYSVWAAQDDFVPSITYKGEPEIVEKENEKGELIIGEVVKQDPAGEDGKKPENPMEGEHLSYVCKGCLLVTPVSEVDTQEALPKEAAEELKYVYKELSQGDMKLPYEEVEGINADEMVIRELLDLSWICGTPGSDHDHPTEVEPDGVVFDLTFDLGVSADAKVVVMVYRNGVWEPIVDVINNGDGTATCIFEYLCPVAISVEQSEKDAIEAPQTGDDANVGLWVGIMAVALVGLLALILVYRRQSAKKN